VTAPDTAAILADEADEIVYLAAPASFFAIGQWYRHFDQVSDDEVRRLLADEVPPT
jgi:putative phosphoribosyl transferase